MKKAQTFSWIIGIVAGLTALLLFAGLLIANIDYWIVSNQYVTGDGLGDALIYWLVIVLDIVGIVVLLPKVAVMLLSIISALRKNHVGMKAGATVEIIDAGSHLLLVVAPIFLALLCSLGELPVLIHSGGFGTDIFIVLLAFVVYALMLLGYCGWNVGLIICSVLTIKNAKKDDCERNV